VQSPDVADRVEAHAVAARDAAVGGLRPAGLADDSRSRSAATAAGCRCCGRPGRGGCRGCGCRRCSARCDSGVVVGLGRLAAFDEHRELGVEVGLVLFLLGYGMRLNPVSHIWRLHAGTDISSGCGKPIYAAHSGTVGYAAWNGSYGNFILINNGDNISTAYGHIVNGGTLVSKGQQVNAGDLIAYVGTTGGSTGCHLHYEVRVNGEATDAVPFMRNQGVTLG
jgi:hypothetical protein